MIRTLHEDVLAEGISVPLAKLYDWFGILRRTMYYKPTKAAPKVDPRFADPIKAEPSFGHRTVAWFLGFNKNRVQRILQIKGAVDCHRQLTRYDTCTWQMWDILTLRLQRLGR